MFAIESTSSQIVTRAFTANSRVSRSCSFKYTASIGMARLSPNSPNAVMSGSTTTSFLTSESSKSTTRWSPIFPKASSVATCTHSSVCSMSNFISAGTARASPISPKHSATLYTTFAFSSCRAFRSIGSTSLARICPNVFALKMRMSLS